MSSKLESLKKSFQNQAGLIHLNNAGLAPSSREAHDAVVYWMDRFRREGMHCNDAYLAAVDQARIKLGQLLNCEDAEIAFFQSTAGAISQVAFGMKLAPGDEVLTWDQEYPSNLYPWKAACDRSGAQLKLIASGTNLATPSDVMINAITPKTRVIAISWVQYQSGAITDLAPLIKVARQKGIWTVVDAIQGVGLLPLDFAALGVDAVCGGSHKWLLSPVGVGYLAIRRERIRELSPLIIGAATYGTCDDPANFECLPKSNAWKFEAGSKQVLEIVALGESAQLIFETGVGAIQAESERLATRLEAGLADAGFALHSPHPSPGRSNDGSDKPRGSIVCFSEPQENRALGTTRLEAVLRKNQISYALRGPGIRLSPHAFNSDAEIDLTIEVLSK